MRLSRWKAAAGGCFVAFALARLAAACDDGSDQTLEKPARPNNPVEGGADATEAAAETGTDGPSDAPVDSDAPVVQGASTIATGSSPHPDAVIGNGDHTCVIAGPSRSVYCWGANEHGQLGLGATLDAGVNVLEDSTTASRLAVDEQGIPLEGADEIALAGWHGCLRRANDVYCWGQRFSGAQAEPPYAMNPDRAKPRLIGNVPIARVVAGGPHTCVVRATGKLACFGLGAFGELGRATATPCAAPIFYDYGASGVPHTCAGDLLDLAKPSGGVQALAAGEAHTCVVVGQKASCWGANDKGQLGTGPGLASVDPAEVLTDAANKTPLAGVTAISAGGGRHTCTLASGKPHCWGANEKGQLGTDPVATPSRSVAAPIALDGVASIAVADGITCVVTTSGEAMCWGADELGQLGDGDVVSKPTPVKVKGPGGLGVLNGVVAIAPGVRHVCALRTDASAWCWGKNDRGQLGDGTKVDSPYPVKVKGVP